MNAPDQTALAGMEAVDEDKDKVVELIARVRAVAVKIVFPFIAKDDVRQYLCGVNMRPLESGGVMVMASDGHRFVVVRDSEGFVDREITVLAVKDGMKHCTGQATFDVLSDGRAMVSDKTAMPLFIQPGNSLIEGNYPRLENVVDSMGYVQGVLGAFNPAYLADAVEVSEYFRAVRFFSRPGDYPLLFACDDIAGIECVGGIMCLRDSVLEIPAWMPRRGQYASLADV